MGLVLQKKVVNKVIKFTLLALRLGVVVYIGAFIIPQIKLVVDQTFNFNDSNNWRHPVNQQEKASDDFLTNESYFNTILSWILWAIISFTMLVMVFAYFFIPCREFSVILVTEDAELMMKHAHYLLQNFVLTILTVILAIVQIIVVPPLFYVAAIVYGSFRFVWKGDIFI